MFLGAGDATKEGMGADGNGSVVCTLRGGFHCAGSAILKAGVPEEQLWEQSPAGFAFLGEDLLLFVSVCFSGFIGGGFALRLGFGARSRSAGAHPLGGGATWRRRPERPAPLLHPSRPPLPLSPPPFSCPAALSCAAAEPGTDIGMRGK